jgi:hypothetical protein
MQAVTTTSTIKKRPAFFHRGHICWRPASLRTCQLGVRNRVPSIWQRYALTTFCLYCDQHVRCSTHQLLWHHGRNRLTLLGRAPVVCLTMLLEPVTSSCHASRDCRRCCRTANGSARPVCTSAKQAIAHNTPRVRRCCVCSPALHLASLAELNPWQTRAILSFHCRAFNTLFG